MSEIFLSWSSADGDLPLLLRDRLRDAGLEVVEYTDSMTVGDNPLEWIADQIRQATITVICISSKSASAEWLISEIALALAQVPGETSQQRVAPVLLDDVAVDRLPKLIQGLERRRVTVRSEGDVLDLVASLYTSLGFDAPVVIPAALIAMTATEFEALLSGSDGAPWRSAIAELCQAAGMGAPPALFDELRSRYGATPEDFAPYGNCRLVEMIRSAQAGVNVKRRADQRRPVALRWFTRQDFSDDTRRTEWSAGHSILVVDSLSALQESSMRQLGDLPDSKFLHKRVLIWVPPYTRHTGSLQALIKASLSGQARLSDHFRDWKESELHSNLSFDMPSETTLRRWLQLTLDSVEVSLQPNSARRDRVAQSGSSSFRPPIIGTGARTP